MIITRILIILFIITNNTKSLKAQLNPTDHFQKNITNANTLSDTIASILSLKTTSILDTAARMQNLTSTLSETYPEWLALEKKLFRNVNLTIQEIVDLHDQENKPPLKKYYSHYIQLQKISAGDKDLTAPKYNQYPISDTDKILHDGYTLLQHSIQYERDSLNSILEKITAIDYPELYPGFKLYLMDTALRTIDPKYTKESAKHLEYAIGISENIDEYYFRAKLQNLITLKSKAEGDYAKSIDASLKVIDYAKKAKWNNMYIMSQINHSSFHQEQGRFEEAYKMLNEALDFAIQINDSVNIARAYANIGNAKMNEKKYEEAIEQLKIAVTYFPGKDLHSKLMTYSNLIVSYYCIGELDSTHVYFQKILVEDPNDNLGIHNYSKAFVAQYYVERGEYDIARKYIEDGLADAEAYDDLSTKSTVLLAKSRLYEKTGNYVNALEIFKQHMELEQDFRNEENAAKITAAKMKSDFDGEKEIIALKNEKEKLNIKNQRNRALFFGGLAILGALSAYVFYFFLKRKNKTIQENNQKLKELNTIKDTLFQIIGHDLKKPSINFRNVSQNINYLLDKKDYKRLKALGEDVDQDAKSLYMLTDNLLNWALMQKDIINIKASDVRVYDIVNYNCDLFQSLAKRKNITLINNTTKNVMTKVDRNSLDTIVRNLIDNAIKYTPENGTITISDVIKQGMVHILVEDNGVGMDQSQLSSIKNKNIVDSSKGTDGEKGSGIGLQLVKQLLHKNNGKLVVSSSKGTGSVFDIALPLSA